MSPKAVPKRLTDLPPPDPETARKILGILGSAMPDRPTQLLTVHQAAARLACSRAHVYRLISAGALRSVELRQPTSVRPKTRVREEDIEAFIDGRTRNAPVR